MPRPTGRILVNLMMVASLLLCVAAAVLWARSCWVVDTVALVGPASSVKVSSSGCTAEIWWLRGRMDGFRDGWSYENWSSRGREDLWGMYEFRTDGGLKAAIPLWFLCLIGGTVAGVGFVARRIRGRRVIGHSCRNCGYDCRATPDRCPECGTVAPTAAGGTPAPQAEGKGETEGV